ncbi:hypothetical protein TTRE_0000689701 [Trichuris trichiura]|uniref:Uncharacterized protein n=1 Tax=Trichuris trichiura TaxID=36087 RepID=A0A077ZDY7_TRITR|nr:hypothetical protein TTRE_0000689701 [Trichuris trichiura]
MEFPVALNGKEGSVSEWEHWCRSEARDRLRSEITSGIGPWPGEHLQGRRVTESFASAAHSGVLSSRLRITIALVVEEELYKRDKEVRKRPFSVENGAGVTPIPSIRVDFAEPCAPVLTLFILGGEENKDCSCRPASFFLMYWAHPRAKDGIVSLDGRTCGCLRDLDEWTTLHAAYTKELSSVCCPDNPTERAQHVTQMNGYMCIIVFFCVAASFLLNYWAHTRAEDQMVSLAGRNCGCLPEDAQVAISVENGSGVPHIPSIRVDFTEPCAPVLALFMLGVEENKDYSCRLAPNDEEVRVSEREHWCAVETLVDQCGRLTRRIVRWTEEAVMCLRVFTHIDCLFNHQRSKNADTSFGARLCKARKRLYEQGRGSTVRALCAEAVTSAMHCGVSIAVPRNKVKLQKAVEIIFNWSREYTTTKSYLHEQAADSHAFCCWCRQYVCFRTQPRHRSAVERPPAASYCRRVGERPVQLGGRGMTVELDECLLSRRKYNRQKMYSPLWLFGGV